MAGLSLEELRYLLLQAYNEPKQTEKITPEDLDDWAGQNYKDESIDVMNFLNSLASDENTYESRIGEYPLRLAFEKLDAALPNEFSYNGMIFKKPRQVDIALFDATSWAASVVETQGKDVLIRINSGLLLAANKIVSMMAKIASFVINGDWKLQNIEKHLLDSPLILKLLECFTSYVFVEGISLLSDRLYPRWGVCTIDNETEFEINTSLMLSFLSFIVAHELSHVMLNHFSDEHTLEKECAADELAVFVLNHFMGISGFEGAMLALNIANIIEEAQKINGTYVAKTHPPTMQRLNMVLYNLLSKTPSERHINAVILGGVFAVYWETLDEFIDFLKSKGVYLDAESIKAEGSYSALLKRIYDLDGFCEYLLCK